jgi:hypothetical protein
VYTAFRDFLTILCTTTDSYEKEEKGASSFKRRRVRERRSFSEADAAVAAHWLGPSILPPFPFLHAKGTAGTKGRGAAGAWLAQLYLSVVSE